MSSISVVIPNYNRASLIEKTIDNLFDQTMPPYEVIVVDDGSTDDSIEVIQSFGDKVRLIKQTNQGPGAARNAGMSAASGDYVQFQDSDDLFALNKLQVQAVKMDQTGSDIVLSPWAHVFIDSGKLSFESCVLQQSTLPQILEPLSWLLRGWTTIFQSMLFRRNFLMASEGYRTDIRYGEDMEFLCRLLLQSPKVSHASETITLYRVDAPNKLSQNGGSSKLKRDVDWARCLDGMWSEQKRSALKVDRMTKWLFLTRVRKHLRYLKNTSDVPSGLIQSLNRAVNDAPVLGLATMELVFRLLERFRLMARGNRWMPALQAGQPSSIQRKLICDLGLEIQSKEV